MIAPSPQQMAQQPEVIEIHTVQYSTELYYFPKCLVSECNYYIFVIAMLHYISRKKIKKCVEVGMLRGKQDWIVAIRYKRAVPYFLPDRFI